MQLQRRRDSRRLLTVLQLYAVVCSSSGTAITPWKWSAVCSLQDGPGALFLPIELQLFVLVLGWRFPLSVEHDPLTTAWMMSHYWRDAPDSFPDRKPDLVRDAVTLGGHSSSDVRVGDGGPNLQLRLGAGGYMLLGESELIGLPDKVVLVGVSDRTHGVVYCMDDISDTDSDCPSWLC